MSTLEVQWSTLEVQWYFCSRKKCACIVREIISLLLQLARLKGGVLPWQGRVEVFKDNEWGTVCDVRFDAYDGNVLCRELGYGSVKTIFPRARLGQAMGKIHLSNCRLATRNFSSLASSNSCLIL